MAERAKIRHIYGFIANPDLTLRQRACARLSSMQYWEYENRPTALAFHNLTTRLKPRPYLQSLLGLGLKFCVAPATTNSYKLIKAPTCDKLQRSLELAFSFAGKGGSEDYNPKMYIPSNWTPPSWEIANQLYPRLHEFNDQLKKLFKPRSARPNLLLTQSRALSDLKSQQEFLIVPTDKNLGPSIIERQEYIQTAMREHLNVRANYKQLGGLDQGQASAFIKVLITQWLDVHKDSFSKSEKKFIKHHLRTNKSPFGRFYLTLKVHKQKPNEPIPSRPIVSCPGSLLYPAGVYVNDKLKLVAQQQPSYIKSSYTFKQKLHQLEIPPFRVSLFTADAVAMYTNIPTDRALIKIKQHLRDNAETYSDIPIEATLEGLEMVMKFNIFTFGDLTFLQRKGTAMGAPPAPQIATIYYATEEANFLPIFQDRLIYYGRYLDDVFGIWLHHNDPAIDATRWQEFQVAMNSNSGLTWEFSELSLKVNFLDLTVNLDQGIITTTLYEKELNLHLYIPPHSAHAPGLLPGIVFGTLFRIYTLCTTPEDKIQRTKSFYHRLKARGYQDDKLLPLFNKAIARARIYTGPTNAIDNAAEDRPVFFHLQFHPQDPPPHLIQRVWRETVLEPKYKQPLWTLRNPKSKAPCGVRRMIIAFRRPMNLGNLLSHRDLNPHPNHAQLHPNAPPGPPVSSYYQPD